MHLMSSKWLKYLFSLKYFHQAVRCRWLFDSLGFILLSRDHWKSGVKKTLWIRAGFSSGSSLKISVCSGYYLSRVSAHASAGAIHNTVKGLSFNILQFLMVVPVGLHTSVNTTSSRRTESWVFRARRLNGASIKANQEAPFISDIELSSAKRTHLIDLSQMC